MNNWFEVDKAGLAKLLERRGKEFLVLELLQNCWDEPGVTEVSVAISYEGYNKAMIVVQDDAPEGFKNQAHSYTLFAESSKKSNPEQRGRFNLGEKLVLALCDRMTLMTVGGGFEFNDQGRHHRPSWKRDKGTRIECYLRLKQHEVEHICGVVHKLIAPPEGIKTMINGYVLPRRSAFQKFTAKLQTELGEEDGMLRRGERETTVTLFPKVNGERATIYEMGIPVCETDDLWHYDIGQKIPLTLDRANVLPGFLKRVRVEVFNRFHGFLKGDDMNSPWVTEAMESKEIETKAVNSYATQRFGEQRVSYDPSDPEANNIAVSRGMTVVHGGMMSAAAWENVRNAEAIKPAGQVTPSAKVWDGEDNPDAKVCPPIAREDWTPDMTEVAEYAHKVASVILKRPISVQFYSSPHMLAGAAYGPGSLSFNKMRLGNAFFDMKINRHAIEKLLIHEFGHEYSGNHLSEDYHAALCKIGALWVKAVREGKL